MKVGGNEIEPMSLITPPHATLVQPQSEHTGFSIVRQHRRMLANMNVYLTEDSRILDFGCGSGQLVYEYRDAGFDAYGFDIRSAPVYRKPGDERFFRLALTGKPVNVPEFEVSPSSYKVPFEDEFFEFVFSTSTLEHVLDHDLAFAEMRRVLRSGGVAIHTFPARYSPVEPHIYVPFGGAMQNYAWYLLWACLGVRNEFQRNMGPVECAQKNLQYARTGVKYLKPTEIRNIARKYFREVQFIPRLWELGDRGSGSLKAALLVMPVVHRYFSWFYNRFFTVVLFLRK